MPPTGIARGYCTLIAAGSNGRLGGRWLGGRKLPTVGRVVAGWGAASCQRSAELFPTAQLRGYNASHADHPHSRLYGGATACR